MSSVEDLEPVAILPDRLAAADFSMSELRQIMGTKIDGHDAAKDSFNWIAAYLCEEVGFYENELVDWFRSPAKGLGLVSPLDTWASSDDGPLYIFEYAQECKAMIDEDLAEEPEDPMASSHRLGYHALEVVRKGFWVAGINVGPAIGAPASRTDMYALESRQEDNSLTARWRGSQNMDEWRITKRDGPRTSTYFVIRAFPPESEYKPFILQTGIGVADERDADAHELDTDLDGRPPSIGEVASFVVPLAVEVRNRTLALVE